MVLSNQDISLSYNILDLYYSYYTVFSLSRQANPLTFVKLHNFEQNNSDIFHNIPSKNTDKCIILQKESFKKSDKTSQYRQSAKN